MIWTKVKRIARSGFVNFWRNGFVSLSAVLVMIVTLFTIGSVVFLGAILSSTLQSLKDKVDINVYFVTSAPEEDILAIQEKIEALPEVKSVEYVSREQALENFKERHKDEQLTLQALEELDENPLGANLNIKANDPSHYESIAGFLESDNVLSGAGARIVDNVNFSRNRLAIDRLSKIIDSADKVGFGVSILLIVLSIIITFNTIRLTLYISRDEISVMQLVGASYRYIRGPFVISGVMYGFVAGIITLILFYPLTYWFREVSENFLAGFNLFEYYIANFGQMFLLIAGAGIVVGGISSYLAVRRYLKL